MRSTRPLRRFALIGLSGIHFVASACGGTPTVAPDNAKRACEAFTQIDSNGFREVAADTSMAVYGPSSEFTRLLNAALNDALVNEPETDAPPLFTDLRLLATSDPIVPLLPDGSLQDWDPQFTATFDRVLLTCETNYETRMSAPLHLEFRIVIESSVDYDTLLADDARDRTRVYALAEADRDGNVLDGDCLDDVLSQYDDASIVELADIAEYYGEEPPNHGRLLALSIRLEDCILP